MIPLPQYKDKVVAVLGLGRTGLSASEALLKSGADVWAWDDDSVKREEAAKTGLVLTNLAEINWRDINRFVLSPGIPTSFPKPHPIVEMAKESGVFPTIDIELLWEAQPRARYIGITGSNGKSTTTSLIGHLLKRGGQNVQVGGNIGWAALNMDPFMKSGTYVLEVSSFQLELIDKMRFNTAVLLNLSENHLDRHGTLDHYVAAKLRLFENQKGEDACVVGIDDPLSAAIYEGLLSQGKQTVFPISSAKSAPGGVFTQDSLLFDDMEQTQAEIGDISFNASLKGAHNFQNICAAYTVARLHGMRPKEILKHLATFEGLPHRQEYAGEKDGLVFINDSKGTSPEATAKALASYDNIYLIAGGRAKTPDLAAMRPYFKRLKKAYVIGEAQDLFAREMEGKVDYQRCGTLDKAFAAAVKEAQAPATILLSPACTSWDQFQSFEQRGDTFKKLVADFKDAAGTGARFG